MWLKDTDLKSLDKLYTYSQNRFEKSYYRSQCEMWIEAKHLKIIKKSEK